jgi:hypothetical protein
MVLIGPFELGLITSLENYVITNKPAPLQFYSYVEEQTMGCDFKYFSVLSIFLLLARTLPRLIILKFPGMSLCTSHNFFFKLSFRILTWIVTLLGVWSAFCLVAAGCYWYQTCFAFMCHGCCLSSEINFKITHRAINITCTDGQSLINERIFVVLSSANIRRVQAWSVCQ